jgi:hypothetical protein
MIDLKTISKIYEGEISLYSEKGILDGIILIQNWEKLNDQEKIDYRKNKLKYYMLHFNDSEHEKLKNNYEESVILVSELILKLLNTYKINSLFDVKNNYFNRLYLILYCELTLINKNISFKSINHIPIIIFEPLIELISSSKFYYLYNLDNLFKEYNNMIKMFYEKPYSLN